MEALIDLATLKERKGSEGARPKGRCAHDHLGNSLCADAGHHLQSTSIVQSSCAQRVTQIWLPVGFHAAARCWHRGIDQRRQLQHQCALGIFKDCIATAHRFPVSLHPSVPFEAPDQAGAPAIKAVPR